MTKGRTFKRVLECGAGEGSILQRLDEAKVFPELHALEISDSGIEAIRKRSIPSLNEIRKFDGYTIPYPDDSFDMVYCSHVIEHVEHQRLLLRELRRVARHQVFEVPLDYHVGVHKGLAHYLGYGHINIFTPSLFKFLVMSENFKILKERRTQLSDEVQRFMWYELEKQPRTWRKEWWLKLRPLRERLRKGWMGKNRYNEMAFSAYTCLCEREGDLNEQHLGLNQG